MKVPTAQGTAESQILLNLYKLSQDGNATSPQPDSHWPGSSQLAQLFPGKGNGEKRNPFKLLFQLDIAESFYQVQ